MYAQLQAPADQHYSLPRSSAAPSYNYSSRNLFFTAVGIVGFLRAECYQVVVITDNAAYRLGDIESLELCGLSRNNENLATMTTLDEALQMMRKCSLLGSNYV